MKPKAEEKPMEWRLGQAIWAPVGRLIAYEKSDINTGKVVKVIEKSAYDSLKALCDEMAEALEPLNLADTAIERPGQALWIEADEILEAKEALEKYKIWKEGD